MEDLSNLIIMQALRLAVPVVIGFLVYEVHQLVNWATKKFQSSVSATNQSLIENLRMTFVHSAEASRRNADLQQAGELKMQWATTRLQRALDKRGIPLSVDEIRHQIEAARFKEFGGGTNVRTPAPDSQQEST